MPTIHETRMINRGVVALNRHHSVDVILSRGSMRSEAFAARRRDMEHEAIGQEIGLEAKILMRDYMLPASLCVIGAAAVEPRAGDLIIEGDEAYEIQHPDANTPACVTLPGGLQYLAHTKRLVGFDLNKFGRG